MDLCYSVSEIQEYLSVARRQGLSIGFVPTLGCLHVGHEALFEAAKKECDVVVGSIFVNPLQFRQERYECYPRDLENDVNVTEKAGVDALFVPSIEEVFPETVSYGALFEWQGSVFERSAGLFVKETTQAGLLLRAPSGLTEKMDGGLHPWHYDGVVTVVYRLFQIVMPTHAYFGEKDPQQLALIARMASEYQFAINIRRVATVREKDGLAYSSRNIQLTTRQRESALDAGNALKRGLSLLNEGERDAGTVLSLMQTELNKVTGLGVEYIGIVDKNHLSDVDVVTSDIIIYLAYTVDGIRLTDNLIYCV